MRHHIPIPLFCLLCVTAPLHADDATPTGDPAVLAAITRSLPFLEQKGVAWMDERNCLSCHHVPFLLWTHRAAQSRGIAVDDKKLAEWDEWARNDSLAHRNLFRLQVYELGKVPQAKLPDPVREKLKPLIEVPFKTEAEFVARLAPLLSEEERGTYQSLILQTAERPLHHVDRAGGGLDVLGQLLLGHHGTPSRLAQTDFRQGTVELLERSQLPEGSWPPGNQFATMRRWPLTTANQTTTMWIALSLAAYEPENTPRSPVLEQAIAWERQQSPHTDNREWLATRLLFERQFGDTAGITNLRQQLREAAGSDGGWGWEPGLVSDPLTTGLALYALAKAPVAEDAAVIQRARSYLVSTQQVDGSWLSPSRSFTKSTEPERLKARDEIYHYWGTAWAVIGLLETRERNGD